MKCLCDRNHLYLNEVNEIINILQEPMYIAIRLRSAPKGKRQYVPRDQVSSWPGLLQSATYQGKSRIFDQILVEPFFG